MRGLIEFRLVTNLAVERMGLELLGSAFPCFGSLGRERLTAICVSTVFSLKTVRLVVVGDV